MITRIMNLMGYVKKQELEAVKAVLERATYDAERYQRYFKTTKSQLCAIIKERKETAVSLIKFNARLPSGEVVLTEFTLGQGPCGKTVRSLDVRHTKHELSIIQMHTDGSYKRFHYFNCDIVGRVQVDYETQGNLKGAALREWLTSRP